MTQHPVNGPDGPTAVPRLRMRGIVKRFPGTVASDGTELTVLPGEVHCLLGQNGAGKSTLMKILAGSYQPDEGEILLDGEPVRLSGPQAGMAAGIAVIYQELDLVPDQTVAQNLLLGRAPAAGPFVRDRRRRELARAAIERVGGTFPVTATVRDLPIAAQQLTAIARALTADARVIVMDEPSATLGEADLEAVFAVIRSLTAEGRSVIYISHRMDEVMEIGDRATVLRDGRTVGVFDIARTSKEELVAAMIGDSTELVHPADRPAPTGEPLLEIDHVRFPGLLDVSGISVRPGEIVGLAGLGGAGRTTLLRALFGDARGDVAVRLAGRPVRLSGPAAAVRAGFALVPESRKEQGLLLGLSVGRNAAVAALGRPPWLLPRRTGARRAAPVLAGLGVRHASAGQPVGELSGGNQQKVVLAKWITRGGLRVLLLDEPTRGLDVGAKADLFREVRRLADSGVAVLLASSELTELTANADTVWVLHEGRNVGRFDPRTTPENTIAHTVITGVTP
ncbi:sugar ABC transporter ATP-binding protein [Marinitenerispora sediminis]|uniref:Sugar ABC transporter ATP-binding protein n=1 Tax=Marinitenerispora sediminis TaxID=1931232 RepID=A0A368T534_9ACTN|nr:sugar ABC transporter ATP-binding protein [Marinitenerispora sediminis]RCV57799.1 sugar ABC transporter ATP-binding protein [Marinitenerispora sediminis]RCV58368.1 sugar ABC transporter ATP-binding protein [Marinitenerispora sediminis]RCV59544.1 sugar ABC transporter ATP-binding protein [Marinitenerispora sediminis]